MGGAIDVQRESVYTVDKRRAAPVPLLSVSFTSLFLSQTVSHSPFYLGEGFNQGMDPKECEGNDRENEKEEKKEKDRRIRRRPFLRYLERRRTDTIVDDDSGKVDVNINTLVRRSHSDKTEYSAKLQGKSSPSCSPGLHGNDSPLTSAYTFPFFLDRVKFSSNNL